MSSFCCAAKRSACGPEPFAAWSPRPAMRPGGTRPSRAPGPIGRIIAVSSPCHFLKTGLFPENRIWVLRWRHAVRPKSPTMRAFGPLLARSARRGHAVAGIRATGCVTGSCRHRAAPAHRNAMWGRAQYLTGFDDCRRAIREPGRSHDAIWGIFRPFWPGRCAFAAGHPDAPTPFPRPRLRGPSLFPPSHQPRSGAGPDRARRHGQQRAPDPGSLGGVSEFTIP